MQIGTTARIEKCEIKKGTTGLKFSELKLTSGQIEHIAELVEGEDVVNITIEAVQKQLPFEEPKKSKGKKRDGKTAAANDKTSE